MKKFVKKIFEMTRKEEYKRLVSIMTWLFMIIIPSYLAISLYKSDLFNILDVIEITLICLASNALLIFISFIVIYTINERRYDIISEDYEVAVLRRSILNLKSFIFFITFVMPIGKFWI